MDNNIKTRYNYNYRYNRQNISYRRTKDCYDTCCIQLKNKKSKHSKHSKRNTAGGQLIKRIALSMSAILACANLVVNKQINKNTENTNIYPTSIQTEAAPEITTELSTEDVSSSESTTQITEPPLEKQDICMKISNALINFSSDMNQDGMELIQKRVEEIGAGEVDVSDVLKILYIESGGKVYEDESKTTLLSSFTGEAFGPFQLTPDTVDYLNQYFELENTPSELDITNPYDNLDACIYTLRFLKEKRTEDINNHKSLPTGTNLKDAVIWSYHDGAWADDISYYGLDYLEKYHSLSGIEGYLDYIKLLSQ